MHGVGATIEHKQALKNLSPNTVVDIGANKGQFTLFALDAYPTAKIIAFDPLRRAAEKFLTVTRQEKNRVVFHRYAIGPITDKAKFFVSKREDSSSLLPISGIQEEIFPGTGLDHTEVVDVTTLDQVLSARDIQPPALLKLDVQGYELETLKGCKTLLQCFSHIYAECSFVQLYSSQATVDEIIEFLSKAGFRFCGIYNMTYCKNGQTVQADFLFRKSKSLKEKESI